VGGNQPDGTACGSGHVCSSGVCTAQCVAGSVCTPIGAPDPCKNYTNLCASTLARSVCAPSANKPDGTVCNGTSTCLSGGCVGSLTPPTLSPPGGSGAPGLAVVIAGPDPAAIVYFTTDGTAPSDSVAERSSTFVGGGTVILQTTTTVQAFATLGGQRSATAIGIYTVTPPPAGPAGVSLGTGFVSGSMQTNGGAAITGGVLRLTSSLPFQVASAFYPLVVNVQSFTTDFSFQLVEFVGGGGDGITFTVQGAGPYAMGSQGGGLGYGPDPMFSLKVLRIERSVAVKFDIYDNAGEGYDSTGLYTDGQVPSIPALDLAAHGINLGDQNVFDVHMVYDGSILTMTISERGITPVRSFTTTFPVDIPAHVGDVTGFVGFTASTGEKTSSQQILRWTFSNSK
jgi:hypothetical protein